MVEFQQAEKAAVAILPSEPPSGTSNENTSTDAEEEDDRSVKDAPSWVNFTIPIAQKQHTPSLTENQEASTTAQGRDSDLPGDPVTEQRVQVFSCFLKQTYEEGENPVAIIREMLKHPQPPTDIDTSSKAYPDNMSELHSLAGGQQAASQQRSELLQHLQLSVNPPGRGNQHPKQSVLSLGSANSLAGLASNLLGTDTAMPSVAEKYTYTQHIRCALTVTTVVDTAETAEEFAAPDLLDEYKQELSPSTDFGAGTLREIVQSYVASPPATSVCAALYPMVGHTTPLINNMFKQQWINGVFLTQLLGDSNIDLRSAPSLFWTLPPNQAVPGYPATAAAAISYGKPTSKRHGQQMATFGQLNEVNDIILALLHFAAAIAIMAKPADGQTPALVLVCETMAATLHTPLVCTALQQDCSKQRERCHHAFAVIHDVLADSMTNMTHFHMKRRAVNDGKVPAALV